MTQTFGLIKLYANTFLLVCVAVITVVGMPSVSAQDAPSPINQTIDDVEEQSKLDRLQSIGALIRTKRTQRDELTTSLEGAAPDAMQDERARLSAVTQDLASLRTSFESALLPDVDTQLMSQEEDSQFDWRGELLQVVEPLLISVKSMTERPRQLTELREIIELSSKKLAVAEDAIDTINQVSQQPLNDGAAARLQATREKWLDARNLVNESLQISRDQLAWTIHETPDSFTRPFFCSGFWEGAEYGLYFRLSRIR